MYLYECKVYNSEGWCVSQRSIMAADEQEAGTRAVNEYVDLFPSLNKEVLTVNVSEAL